MSEVVSVSRTSLKRARATSDECNGLSKCKKSFRKKHGREFKDLPSDLVEEVLSRVPATSLRRVRSTCKTWNTLSTSKSFAEKHLAFEKKKFNWVVMEMDYKIYLMSINLNLEDSSCIIKPRGKLVHSDDFDVSQIYHCDDGLLLCVPTLDKTKVVVWNPYSGQTRWIHIPPTPSSHRLSYFSYALGYDTSTKSHKILRFVDNRIHVDFNIYDLSSGSWRLLDFPTTSRNWTMGLSPHRGVSLKGNTYWSAIHRGGKIVLVSFDYTTETFGPPLPLPPQCDYCWLADTLILSTVRDQQLVVLFQQWDTLSLQIFITSNINPTCVSWSNTVFLQINMGPLTGIQFTSGSESSFFIDEDKKVAVVFDKDTDPITFATTRNTAFILGVDGSMKQVDLGDSPYENSRPLVLPYAPTLLHLNH